MPGDNLSVWTRCHCETTWCDQAKQVPTLSFLGREASKDAASCLEDHSTACASPASMSLDLSGCVSPSDAFFDPPCEAVRLPPGFHSGGCLVPDYGDASNVWTPESLPVISNERCQSHLPLERTCTLTEVTNRVWLLSQDRAGCRQVQCALEESKRETCQAIASELRGHVWEAVEHCHANFVLQRCIERLSSHGSQWIIDELQRLGSATYLATHRFGCRIFERLLEHCTAEQVHPLVDELLCDNVGAICADQFGNYVFQHLLEHLVDEGQRRRLMEALVMNVGWMCTDYYAAGVVSHALVHCSVEEKRVLGSALLEHPDQLLQMVTQRFGRLIVERLVQVHWPGREELCSALTARLAMHRRNRRQY